MARHGLGLYIYAGEDIPDESDGTAEPVKKAQPKKKEEPAQELNYRAELRKFVEENGLDAKAIVAACGLKQNSTNDEWKEALRYAINLNNERRAK